MQVQIDQLGQPGTVTGGRNFFQLLNTSRISAIVGERFFPRQQLGSEAVLRHETDRYLSIRV
ncbi:hypothetical protein AUG86_03495 [Euryarchaeota archaeon 13_1_20CM_4_64_14]|nr:MAG: hypothetical protein AUG86_03495 [Euryarchaeota archaeon 13_1_20CM_4_64_14]